MVDLSLDHLQKPSDVNKQTPFYNQFAGIQEPKNEEEIENDVPLSLGQLQTPTTYQAEPETSDEGFLSYLGRQSIRSVSRVAEQVGGGFGNIEKFGKEALTNLPKHIGPVGAAIYDLLGEKGWEKVIKGSEPNQQMFPTSEKLKQTSEIASKGYTSPRTQGEKKADTFFEDVGATINPSGRLNIARNLTIPAAANVVREITEYAGLGEDAANKMKMAVWLPMMLSHSVNGPQHASNLMNEGRRNIPNTVQLNTPRFTNALDQVERTLLTSDPRTALARQMIAGIRTDLGNGQTSAQSLMTMYDAVNAAKRSRGLFELGRADRRFATRAIDQVRDSIRGELMQSASAYPEALNSWSNGVRAWAVVHRSNAITNWIQDHAKGPYAKILTGPAAALFGVGSYGGIKNPLVAGAAAAAVPSVYKTGQVLYRAWQDANLARYYYGAISGAMNENLPVFLNNYNKLNKKLED